MSDTQHIPISDLWKCSLFVLLPVTPQIPDIPHLHQPLPAVDESNWYPAFKSPLPCSMSGVPKREYQVWSLTLTYKFCSILAKVNRRAFLHDFVTYTRFIFIWQTHVACNYSLLQLHKLTQNQNHLYWPNLSILTRNLTPASLCSNSADIRHIAIANASYLMVYYSPFHLINMDLNALWIM